MEPEHQHILCAEELTKALKQAAQKDIWMSLLQEMRGLMLGGVDNVFHLSVANRRPWQRPCGYGRDRQPALSRLSRKSTSRKNVQVSGSCSR